MARLCITPASHPADAYDNDLCYLDLCTWSKGIKLQAAIYRVTGRRHGQPSAIISLLSVAGGHPNLTAA